MSQQQLKPNEAADTYAHVIGSFQIGMVRLWSAEAAYARLVVALLEYRSLDAADIAAAGAHQCVIENLAKIQYDSYDALVYVTDLSLLVYATTLLDTFVTDTTTFLLLKYPKAIGKAQQIPIDNLIAASSPRQLLSEAAARKAREVSYLSFPARIEFLQKSFGLLLDLEAPAMDALEHYPSVRNAAVHDQGLLQLSLSEAGEVTCRQKTCVRHPTAVSAQDVDDARKGYVKVA